MARMNRARLWVLSEPVITAPTVGGTKLQHLDDAIVERRCPAGWPLL